MAPSVIQKAFVPGPSLFRCSFVILQGLTSLREICHGLSCCNGKLVHLGILKPPNKSTLSYANEHRSSELFRDLFWSLLGRFRATGKLGINGKRTFRFKNKLLSFDSTAISLCLSLFPWASFRCAKGGIKVHVLLDHGDYMPSFVNITEARLHDSKVARILSLPQGSIVAIDRAYIDFDLFRKWNEEKVFFVTRMKKNTSYQTCPIWPPKTLQLLGQVFCSSLFWTAVTKSKDPIPRFNL